MITASGDRLSFSFPEVERRLDARVDAYLVAETPRVVGEDRQAAFAALLQRAPYDSQDAAWMQRARAALDGLTDGAVAEAFAAQVWKAVGGRADGRVWPTVSVVFQRTLRLPDDGKDHPLPPGLGAFPLRRIDDLGAATPAAWRARGGIALPMYQGEALWMAFSAGQPAAIKIGAGGINAVTGEAFGPGLHDGAGIGVIG